MNKVLLFVFSVLLISCDKSAVGTEDIEIKSGQSFGECFGACTQILTLTSSNNEIEYLVKYLPTDGNYQDSTYYDVIDTESMNSILNEINTKKFFALESVYGCPDCADGGAEFIEITENGLSHRVTFEYGSSVKGIEDLIKALRAEREKWGEELLP